ncbi:unnamed protein product [Durusdinium trenchii]|uniref:Uncharacterized protein n=1 Tax=Durusdinium trenchii TaxID=1381693 RepID=A0ABP0PPE9_9DINO
MPTSSIHGTCDEDDECCHCKHMPCNTLCNTSWNACKCKPCTLHYLHVAHAHSDSHWHLHETATEAAALLASRPHRPLATPEDPAIKITEGPWALMKPRNSGCCESQGCLGDGPWILRETFRLSIVGCNLRERRFFVPKALAVALLALGKLM